MTTQSNYLVIGVVASAMTGCSSGVYEQGKPAVQLSPLGGSFSQENVLKQWGQPSFRLDQGDVEKWFYVNLREGSDATELLSQPQKKAYVLTVDKVTGCLKEIIYYEDGQKRPLPSKTLSQDLRDGFAEGQGLLEMMSKK